MRHYLRNSFRFIPAITLILMMGTFGTLAFGAPPTTEIQNKLSNNADAAELREQMRQIAREEATASLDKAERGAIDTAAEAMKHNDATMSYVSWLTTILFGFLTIFTGVGLGTVIYGEYGLVKDARANLKKANDDAAASSAIIKQLEQASERVKVSYDRATAFDVAAANALTEIAKYLESLPDVELPAILGGPPEFPTPDEVMKMEEADMVIVLGEKVTPLDPRKFGRAFLSLGKYWRQVGNYARAIARYSRATQLDPTSWEAFEGLARLYVELAAQRGRTPEAKERLLELSESWCKQADKVGGQQAKTYCDLGAIADLRRDFPKAIGFYQQAQKLDPEGKILGAFYNPACIYALELEDYENALAELAKINPRDKMRELVKGDSDFDKLRSDQSFGPRLSALMQTAKN
jgi:tetratricopeptide (TPR) repeat protein